MIIKFLKLEIFQLQLYIRLVIPWKVHVIINSVEERKNFIIGEIKKESPSAGEIIHNYEPIEIAKIYERAGIKALSVLTEKNYFKGEIDHLSYIKQNTNIPIFKNFFNSSSLNIETISNITSAW